MGNAVFIIEARRLGPIWVFDDPVTGMEAEGLVGGMPEIIDLALKEVGIPGVDSAYITFAKDPFPGHGIVLHRLEDTDGTSGTTYRWTARGLDGWLCSNLLKYFDTPPPVLYGAVQAT